MSRRLPHHHQRVANAATGRANGIGLRQVTRYHTLLAPTHFIVQFG
jgi:hypothetical protein